MAIDVIDGIGVDQKFKVAGSGTSGDPYIASVNVDAVVPGTLPASLGKAEDAAHVSGDTGVMMLAVRNDSGSVLAGTTGDYIPVSTDSTGAVRITSTGGGVSANVAGDVAHDAVDSGSPVKIGGYAKATAPSDVSADGDRVNAWFDKAGRLAVDVSKVGGTVTDTNSGTKSAGTLRVVIATDQPALTNNQPVAVKILQGAANIATAQVTASTSAATLVSSRATRRSVTVKNTDGAITVYVGPATVSSSNGMPLLAGESVTLTWVGLVQVIAASGSPVVAVVDEYD